MMNHPLLSHLRAAITAQITLWDALRVLENEVGEREDPSWDDIVQQLAIECDASADELSDDDLAAALSEANA